MKSFFNQEEKEKFEKDQSFRYEALKRILPDTSWYGETYHDNNSVNNIETLEEMAYMILEQLLLNAFVPSGNKGNGSYERIAKEKQKVLKELISNACDNRDLFGFILDYILYIAYELEEDELTKIKKVIELAKKDKSE